MLLGAVLPSYLVGSVAVEIRQDFPFTDAQLGGAVAISFALAAIVSPAAGRTVAWIGVRRGLILATALVTLSSLAIATVADSAAALIALMAVNGLGGGIGSPSLSTLLAHRVAAGRQGAAFGLFTSAPQVAAFVAGLALPVIAEPLGWRVTFAVPVAIGIVSLAALQMHGLPAGAGRADAGRFDRRRLPRSVPVIAASAGLVSAAGVGMRSFLVVFAISVGFQSSLAGLLLAVTGVAALASRVGFGVLSDRRPGSSLHLAAGLMGLCVLGLALMALGGDVAIVLGALLAGGIGWGWQAPLSHAVISQNPDATAVAVGMQMAGFFSGAVVGPLVVGLFAEGDNYTGAWVVCALLAAAGAAMAVLAARLVPDGGSRGHPFV